LPQLKYWTMRIKFADAASRLKIEALSAFDRG
jgi:hypothetical protein